MSCYCYICDKYFHRLGIARHRAMHRDKNEDCKIKYSGGYIIKHCFAENEQLKSQLANRLEMAKFYGDTRNKDEGRKARDWIKEVDEK